jgi:threonine/homoserine/homoserine lactone efflux protein
MGLVVFLQDVVSDVEFFPPTPWHLVVSAYFTAVFLIFLGRRLKASLRGLRWVCFICAAFLVGLGASLVFSR